MNREDIKNKKSNSLIFVGSARGVNRFYITNKIMQKFPKAKAISTGSLINSLAKELGFGEVDKIPIIDYYKYLEPVFVNNILSHLEHENVILDTFFFYITPAISVKGLRKLAEKVSKVIIIFVEEPPEKIYRQKKGRSEEWFDKFDNIEEDILANKEYSNFYFKFFKDRIPTKHLSCGIGEK